MRPSFGAQFTGTFLVVLYCSSIQFVLGTVNRNEQRQGIIVVMVSCLLFCGIKVALCELDRHLYGALMAIASYVHTGSLYTSGKA